MTTIMPIPSAQVLSPAEHAGTWLSLMTIWMVMRWMPAATPERMAVVKPVSSTDCQTVHRGELQYPRQNFDRGLPLTIIQGPEFHWE